MAATGHHNAVPPDTLITIKVSVNDNLKKLKLPLRDLGANVLPDKVSSNLEPYAVLHASPVLEQLLTDGIAPHPIEYQARASRRLRAFL